MRTFIKPSEKQFLKYLDRDYIRLPVNQEKKALVKNWNTYNSDYYKEKRTIKQLLTQYQTYALRTGKRLGNGYYFIVLDLDRNYWGQQIWELGIAWISTKRGGHVYLLLKELPPNGLLFNQTKQKIGEIQSQGKYVIGLGSIHQTGIRYNWERNKTSKWWWKFESVKEMEEFLLEKGIFCQFKKKITYKISNMKIIHLVINGIIGATINSEHLDLNKTTIQEINPNIYLLESKDFYYKWKQKEKGGKIELIHDDNFHQGGFKTNSFNYIEEGKVYEGKEKPLKVIDY